MGLDIVSHRKVRLVGLSSEYLEGEDFLCEPLHPIFAHAFPEIPLISAFIKEEFGFGYAIFQAREQGGEYARTSYWGYSRFRGMLADLVLPEGREHWVPSDPFYEMAYMSDCEGFFTTSVCRKIAKDFDAHREAYAEKFFGFDYAVELYDEWALVFRDAADHEGIVVYQ